MKLYIPGFLIVGLVFFAGMIVGDEDEKECANLMPTVSTVPPVQKVTF